MEIELELELDRKKIGFLLLGTLIGIGVSLGYVNLSSNAGNASEKLVDFLENQSGSNLDVVDAETAGKYYKVDLKTSQGQSLTYYTNGEKFTSNMQDISQLRERATVLADFSQCLANSGTVMFGNASQRATQAQIQALGGSQIVAPIYRDVSNNQTLRQVVQLGIQRVPAFVKNQSAIQGTQTLNQIEQFTGCTLKTN